MFLSKNLRKSREWVTGQQLLGHTGAALHALVLADLAQERVGQVPHRAALDLDAGGVLATGLAVVLADLAHQLGADWAGDGHVGVSVLDVDGGACWVLVVLDLGSVLDTLLGLDDVLAGSRLVDDATLDVHEGRGLGGSWGHLVLLF